MFNVVTYSLRTFFETNGAATSLAGDHVDALLEVYKRGDLPRRWSESALAGAGTISLVAIGGHGDRSGRI